MNKMITGLLFICFVFSGSLYADSPIDERHDQLLQSFMKANKAYDEGRYEKSIQLYENIADGISVGEVYYNLGDANYRVDKLGESIFYFRKAYEFFPRDQDARFNLSFVRNKSVDKIEGGYDFTIPLNKVETELCILMALVLFFLFNVIAMFKQSDWIKWMRNLSLVVSVVMVCYWPYQYLLSKSFGVVVDTNVDIYSNTGKDKVVLFSLHEGAEFSVLKKSKRWIQIKLLDGKRGWIQRKQIIL